TSYCDGSVTNITLSSTIPGTTYTWNALSSNLDTTLVFSGSGSTISQTLDLVNNLNVGFVTYSVTPFANGCSGTPQQITIYANPIPEMTASPTLSEICSGDTAHIDFTSNISGVTYSWTFSATGVTGASNGSGTSINQVLTSSDATTGGFVIYTITPELNGCFGTPVTVQVDVKPRPEFFGTIPTTILCSGETTNIGLSASITGTNFEWTVVSSNVTGASDGSGIAIVQTLEAPSVTGTVIYTVVPVLNGCYGSPITVTVTVNPLPKPVLEDGTLCIIQATGEVYQTYTLNTGLSATGYSFDWYFNGGLIAGANAPTYTADEVGLYSVIVTNTITTCESEEVFATVDFVNPATSFSTVVTEAFTNNATITVSVPDGTGTLLYQLDEGAYQESNVFTGVSAGEHIVTVIDTEGCTFMTQTVLVIDYPKYFTPNGDGHNDTWNIIGMNQADAKLYIFDRYGKLIKQISPSAGSDGWDGTYNGQQLPSTDYWFSLDYTENGAAKQFKAHFSMKR
ncbi:T9SS type B sorting domain-containing protein, partial [Flavobacterium sp.]|uniref:T9SS type B sorting domain-containing protein n=1 Tax=Flavobacterium sp. TaxID=239 RepID=UPI002637CA91